MVHFTPEYYWNILTVLKGFAHLLRKFEPIQIHHLLSSYGCFGQMILIILLVLKQEQDLRLARMTT